MSKTLFVLLFGTWALIVVSQVLSLASGAADGRTVLSVIAIVIAVAGAAITLVLKRRAAAE